MSFRKEKKNIFTWQTAEAERREAVEFLWSESASWGKKEVRGVEDTNLSAGRDVNCAF